MALTGAAIDLVYPELLTNDPPQHRERQIAWMVGLLVLAVVLMPLANWARHHLSGPPEETIDYLQRAAEGYWGWIFVYGFFVFWLGDQSARPKHVMADAPHGTQVDSRADSPVDSPADGGEDSTPPATPSSVHVPRQGRHRAGHPLASASSRLTDLPGEQHHVG